MPDVVKQEPSSTSQDYLVVDRVEHELRSLIKPGIKLPRERDLAEQFGVSRQSVRQAMARLKRDRLVKSIQGKGTFVLSPAQRKTAIHLISSSVKGFYNLMCVGVLTEILRKQGFLVHLVCSRKPFAEWEDITAGHERAAGGILVGSYSYDELKALTTCSDLPLVHVSDMDDRYRRAPLCDTVINDNAAMGFRATDYLIRQGHRRIAFLGWGKYGAIWDREMLRGHDEALRAHNIEPRDDWMIRLPATLSPDTGGVIDKDPELEAAARAQIERWRNSDSAPTAIIHPAGAELPLRECIADYFGDLFDPMAILAVTYWETLLGGYTGETDASAVCIKFQDIAERAVDLLTHRKNNNTPPTREMQGRIFVAQRRQGRWCEDHHQHQTTCSREQE